MDRLELASRMAAEGAPKALHFLQNACANRPAMGNDNDFQEFVTQRLADIIRAMVLATCDRIAEDLTRPSANVKRHLPAEARLVP